MQPCDGLQDKLKGFQHSDVNQIKQLLSRYVRSNDLAGDHAPLTSLAVEW